MTNSPSQLFPSLLLSGQNPYRARPTNFLLSFLVHALAVAVIAILTTWVARDPTVGRQIGMVVEKVGPLTFSMEKPGGHGGGGDHDKVAASKGAVPEMTLQDQLTPPEAVVRNLNPKLPEPPSVMALSAVPLPRLGQLGDPFSVAEGPPSNGTGSRGGIGTGCCGGIGRSNGPGFGPYDEGNVFRPGLNGVSPPRAIYDPEPEYSEEGRKTKQQGSVILWLIVGADGHAHNVRVQRSLGMGLDEKALEAVSQWRFQPAMLNGKPVAVQINVEVSFRLY